MRGWVLAGVLFAIGCRTPPLADAPDLSAPPATPVRCGDMVCSPEQRCYEDCDGSRLCRAAPRGCEPWPDCAPCPIAGLPCPRCFQLDDGVYACPCQ